MKTGKITSVKFSTRWQSPSGSYVYYHDLTFDNGDTGTCGRNKECPDDMKVGKTINYEINDKRIKFVSESKDFKRGGNNRFDYRNGKKSPSEYLGYAYSYAKDLVIAGKVQDKDLQDLQKIASDIYEHIKKLLIEDDESQELDKVEEKKEEKKPQQTRNNSRQGKK